MVGGREQDVKIFVRFAVDSPEPPISELSLSHLR
jgi:hypothetical protein